MTRRAPTTGRTTLERRQFLQRGALLGAGAAATTLAAPAIAQERKVITIVSTWPRDFPGLGTSAQRLAERITEMSEGRLTTEYFAAGERVGAFDVFDEVAAGNSEAYVGTEYYWIGKHPAYAYFTTVPFGMTVTEWNAWIKFGNGQALWDELAGDFGLKGIPCGATGTQAGGWFNKEIESPDDLKGLKMRIPGLGGTVMSKLGASTVSLPGSQIYENLVSGAVDATEWVGPFNDYFMKFYEAAQYYYTAGMHEPGGAVALGFNASFWGSLTDWEKQVLIAAGNEELAAQPEEAAWNNGIYLQRLINDHGVEARKFNEDVWDAFGDAALEVTDETREHSPIAARITEDFEASLRQVAAWSSRAETEFVNQRNRVLDI